MNHQERLNSISEAIIGTAIDVHKAVGPGLLESAYEACLAYELRQRGLKWNSRKICLSTIEECNSNVATVWIYWWRIALSLK